MEAELKELQMQRDAAQARLDEVNKKLQAEEDKKQADEVAKKHAEELAQKQVPWILRNRRNAVGEG
jgi:hypothetical protein